MSAALLVLFQSTSGWRLTLTPMLECFLLHVLTHPCYLALSNQENRWHSLQSSPDRRLSSPGVICYKSIKMRIRLREMDLINDYHHRHCCCSCTLTSRHSAPPDMHACARAHTHTHTHTHTCLAGSVPTIRSCARRLSL